MQVSCIFPFFSTLDWTVDVPALRTDFTLDGVPPDAPAWWCTCLAMSFTFGTSGLFWAWVSYDGPF
jgi:hypothetical protein